MQQKWTVDQLIDQWTLTPDELICVNKRRTDANRLGFALLFKYFQIANRFPRRQNDVPISAVVFVSGQLNLSDRLFAAYNWRGRSIKAHRAAIRAHFGFREGTVADAETTVAWLCEVILPTPFTLDELKNAVYARYRWLKAEPPTVARIERLIRTAQHRYSEQFCQQLASQLSTTIKQRLDLLLELATTSDGKQLTYTPFAILKRDVGNVSLQSILRELDKLQRIQRIQLPSTLFDSVPVHVIKLLHDRVRREPPREARRHPDARRYTLLAAFCHLRHQAICDNLVDLFVAIVKRIEKTAELAADRQLIRTAKRLRGKGKLLGHIAEAALAQPDESVRETIYPVASESVLQRVLAELHGEQTHEETIQQTARRSYASHYRRMIPPLLTGLTFRSNNDVHRPLIEAIALIQRYVAKTNTFYRADETVPLTDVVPDEWRDLVIRTADDGSIKVNRISYEVCVCLALRNHLRCRAIWVVGSLRYRNPDDDLPADFSANKAQYYAELSQPEEAKTFIQQVRQEMVTALTRLDRGLATNAWVTLETHRKHPIRLTPLPAQPPPLNLTQLKREIQSRWPQTFLLDMLKEVDLRTNFTDQFQSSAAQERLAPDLVRKRLLHCLYALGTNTGFDRVGDETTGDMLRHIQRRYLTQDNLRAAIATVVNATFQARQPHIWGEATTACAADSKKFAAWNQNLLTEWHVRYRGPGIMVYWRMPVRALIFTVEATPFPAENGNCSMSYLKAERRMGTECDIEGKTLAPSSKRVSQSNLDMAKAILPESQSQAESYQSGGKDGVTHSSLDEYYVPVSIHVRPESASSITGLTTQKRRLNREYLDKCLNGDCPSSNASLLAMAIEPEYQTRQRSWRSSRRVSRPARGARESRVQGEGQQIFQL